MPTQKWMMVLAGMCVVLSAPNARGADVPSYVIEPPDVLRIDVCGLPTKREAVQGERLVRPDGTVSLGTYGTVPVAGKTQEEVRAAVALLLASHAGKKKDKLEIRVEVAAHNSKSIYVVRSDGDGEQIHRISVSGRDTVASAVLGIETLAEGATHGTVRVASPDGTIRDVDWRAITQRGRTETNFRLQAGDRVYVKSSRTQ